MLELTITNEQKVLVHVAPRTAAGSPALLDGPVRVEVQAGASTVELVEGDLSSFWLTSSDAPGDTTFVVSGDADLGEGITLIQDIVLLHVAGALAESLGLTAEAPVPKAPIDAGGTPA